MMKVRAVLAMIGALSGFLIMLRTQGASAAQPAACSDSSKCAQVSVGGGGSVAPGGNTSISLSFAQGPTSTQTGGIDKIAAVAFTLGMPGTGGTPPLTLADCGFACVGGSNAGNSCSTDADCGGGGQCQVNAVHASVANFKVVIENASCANGRTHCLCPPQGMTPDDFINVVVYGPNPLPTPGPTGIDIPTLPAGPQQLATIDLTAGAGASGQIPLHIMNQVQDATHPQFTALLSVGDKTAVDQTCVPTPGTPPCSAASSVSQVTTTDASVTVTGGCCGDSSGDGAISTGEATNAVLALVNRDVSKNPSADCNHDLAVSTGEATKVILNLVNRVCNP